MNINEMITNYRSPDCWKNSPCQHLRKCMYEQYGECEY